MAGRLFPASLNTSVPIAIKGTRASKGVESSGQSSIRTSAGGEAQDTPLWVTITTKQGRLYKKP